MIDLFKFETKKSKNEILQTMENELQSRGYKRFPQFLSFGLKSKFNIDSEIESYYFFKPLLSFLPIPMWYFGYHLGVRSENPGAVHLLYYTKGLKIFDVFRISNRWQTEFNFFKDKLS